jgi:hypothetical protein
MKKIIATISLIVLLLVASVQIVPGEKQKIFDLNRSFEFTNLTLIDEGSYNTALLDEADASFVQDNYYIVPSSIQTFTYPLGTKIESVAVKPSNIHELSISKPLQIAPQPVIHGMEQLSASEIQYTKNPESISEWYHYDVGCGIIHGIRQIILTIELFPLQYNQYSQSITWAKNLDISISYKSSTNQQQLVSDETYDLIVLSADQYKDELTPLITHKINRGISSKVVTLSDIYDGIYFPVNGRDNPETIKYFIKNAIEQWNTRYVILVGGEDAFPVRFTHVYVSYGSGDGEVFASDLYYADIYNESGKFCSWDSNENDIFGEYQWGDDKLSDEVDIFPDVYLGRLAATNEFEVSSVVDKIITYETQKSYKKDWFSNVVLCGGDTFPGDSGGIDEGEYLCDVVADQMTGFSASKLYVTNGELRTATDISDGLNDGGGFFVLAGHANPQSWSTHPHENEKIWIPTSGFRNTHASSVNNGDKLPILLTESCSPFKYTQSDNCLGWSFVANPTGGVIAGFGCTGLSWGSDGSSVTSSLTGKLLIDTIKAYRKDGAITVGEMYERGINRYYKPYLDGGGHKSVEEWQLFGDPSLSIAEDSQAPLKPNQPIGPGSGTAKETYQYSAETIDPEGDDVYYFFDWGDGTTSGWVGPFNSGKTCELNHSWSSDGSYEIRVKAQDFHGVVSDWSDPLLISMPKNKILNHPLFDWLFDLFSIFSLFLK